MRAVCVVSCPPEAVVVLQPEPPCGCELPWVNPPALVAPVPTGAAQITTTAIRITFDGPVGAIPQVAPTAFSVALTGSTAHVVTATINGGAVVLLLSAPATFTAGTVTYAPTGIGDLRSAANGAPVAGFTQPVTPM